MIDLLIIYSKDESKDNLSKNGYYKLWRR